MEDTQDIVINTPLFGEVLFSDINQNIIGEQINIAETISLAQNNNSILNQEAMIENGNTDQLEEKDSANVKRKLEDITPSARRSLSDQKLHKKRMLTASSLDPSLLQQKLSLLPADVVNPPPQKPTLHPSGFWEQDKKYAIGHYINCDLRYYNLESLGKFDVIMIDPPWRIRGNQLLTDEKTMFNNSKFALHYNTLSNQEILDLDVGTLADSGFLFLWIINSLMDVGYKCLKRWGYTYVDRITWVKETVNNKIAISQGYYFLHSSEICLVGMKCDPNESDESIQKKKLKFLSRLSSDVIFAEIRVKSRKPDQMYEIVENMFPGGRKIEIFGRNHNIRKGWLSVGNQLGEYFDWGKDIISCDQCSQVIVTGQTRYKSKTIPDNDLCGNCVSKDEEEINKYFKIENLITEMTFHQYYACDGCNIKPLWGIRFHCKNCDDCDLCEICYDNKIQPKHLKSHDPSTHEFTIVEMPDLAGGLPVHSGKRCQACLTMPIVGIRFHCEECNSKKMDLCQKCFFLKKEPKKHRASHDMDVFTGEPEYEAEVDQQEKESGTKQSMRCVACGTKEDGEWWKCVSCFNYVVCKLCYETNAPPPPSNTSHRPVSHKFQKIEQ